MMTLYSGSTDPYSHRCRIVLFEKDMDFEVIDVDMHNKPEEVASISPSGKMPVLVERDLILTESNIINEYIDERFPHPQLMPPDPVMRARARLGCSISSRTCSPTSIRSNTVSARPRTRRVRKSATVCRS